MTVLKPDATRFIAYLSQPHLSIDMLRYILQEIGEPVPLPTARLTECLNSLIKDEATMEKATLQIIAEHAQNPNLWPDPAVLVTGQRATTQAGSAKKGRSVWMWIGICWLMVQVCLACTIPLLTLLEILLKSQ